jgi:MFS family permease
MGRISRYLSLLLLFIAVDEVCGNFIYNSFDSLQNIWERKFYFGFLAIQIVAAPIQSGFSDFYLRKKSLITALAFTAIGMSLLTFYIGNSILGMMFLSLAVIIKGTMGNILPIAWAGMADTQVKNFRFSFGLSTAAIAIGYLVLLLLSKSFSQMKNLFIILIMILVSLYLCKMWFFDAKDANHQKLDKSLNLKHFLAMIKRETGLIFTNFLSSKVVRNGLLTFLLWETSFYAPHLLDIDLQLKEFNFVALSMILGYLSGVIFVRYALKKVEDNKIIIGGFVISISSLALILLFFHEAENISLLMKTCYFFYSVGSSFLVPSFFSIMLEEHKPHEQGKLCGLMDSTDTVAFLIAILFSFYYDHLKLKPVYVAYFSFSIFLISFYTYYRFQKFNKKQC